MSPPNPKKGTSTELALDEVQDTNHKCNIVDICDDASLSTTASSECIDYFHRRCQEMAVTVEEAVELGINVVGPDECEGALGRRYRNADATACEGIEIKYPAPTTGGWIKRVDGTDYSRIRFHKGPIDRKDEGKESERRYCTRFGDPHFPYIPPEVHQHLIENPQADIVITEGEFKAIRALKAGCHVIAIPGIWMWNRGKGDKRLHSMLVPYLHRGRRVVMIFDSDARDENKAASFDCCATWFASALHPYGVALYRIDIPSQTQEDESYE